jgi:hypothetical protein
VAKSSFLDKVNVEKSESFFSAENFIVVLMSKTVFGTNDSIPKVFFHSFHRKKKSLKSTSDSNGFEQKLFKQISDEPPVWFIRGK